MYDECKFLFLSAKQADIVGNAFVWKNLPTISESRRQCYITVANAVVVFNTNAAPLQVLVQMNLPTGNYYSSNNDEPIVSFIQSSADDDVYEPLYPSSVKILSTDQLKNIQLKLLNTEYDELDVYEVSSINIMLKLEYIDTQKQVMSYLSTKPSTL
jgi:hypothetical protein